MAEILFGRSSLLRVLLRARRCSAADLSPRVQATLLVRGPLYGLDLMHATRSTPSRLYPVLRRLEAEGLVEAWWEDGPRPRRRVYRLVIP
jgi:DNA-binding transcriptional regulator GbsR (MarR family)